MDSHKKAQSILPNLPICGITSPPSDAILHTALEYTKQHTTPATVNHCLRSACFALLASRKLSHLAHADPDLVVYSCIMHDMGWSKNPSLVSKDKRFEVDGANVARDWIRNQTQAVNWDERQIQLVWDAIALHTSPSISMYKEVEVAAVALGIFTDITGPFTPNALVTEAEYKEVITAIPRIGLTEELVGTLCGMCRDKPATTFDNFVSDFGVKFGLDGKGLERESFAQKAAENSLANLLLSTLAACDQLEQSGSSK